MAALADTADVTESQPPGSDKKSPTASPPQVFRDAIPCCSFGNQLGRKRISSASSSPHRVRQRETTRHQPKEARSCKKNRRNPASA